MPLVHPSGTLLAFFCRRCLMVTTGSMVLLWIAEQITKFGVGNGVSVRHYGFGLGEFPECYRRNVGQRRWFGIAEIPRLIGCSCVDYLCDGGA